MTTFNAVFPDVYVINVPGHTERLKQADLELQRLKIGYEVYSGVVLNAGITEYDRDAGCTLSHIQIIERAEREELPYVCIFEDDVVFESEFVMNVNTVMTNIKKFITENKWDLFYLGGNHLQSVKPVCKGVVKVSKTMTTHAYVVNSSAYAMIRYGMASRIPPVDNLMHGVVQGNGRCYCAEPRVAYQREGHSYIRNGYRNYWELRDKGVAP